MKRKTMSLVICLTLAITVFGLVPERVSAATPFNYGDVFAGVGNGKIRHYDNAGTFIEDRPVWVGMRPVICMPPVGQRVK